MFNFQEVALVGVVALLLFGAERLPKIARSAGEMQREFRKGLDEGKSEIEAAATLPAIAEENSGEQPPTKHS